MQFQFVNVIPKYWNIATFAEGLLAVFILLSYHEFCSPNMWETGSRNPESLNSRTKIEARTSSCSYRFTFFASVWPPCG
jgi:hypothetical protein